MLRLRRGFWTRPRLCAAAATTLLPLVMMSSAPAFAMYPVLGAGYFQRDWLVAESPGELEGAHVVMPDGSLLVLVQPSSSDYELRRYQPDETRLRQGVRFGQPGNLWDVELRGNGLFISQVYDKVYSFYRLLELDQQTGFVRRDVVHWPYAFDIVVDPLTQDFVLFDCAPKVDCFHAKQSVQSAPGGSTRELRVVALDPATGRKTQLIGDVNRTLGAQVSLSLSTDGRTIFVGRKETGIDLYDRSTGLLRSTIPTGAFVTRAVFGPSHGCFANKLVYGLDDGSIWTVDPMVPGSPSMLVAAAGQGLQYEGGDLEFDRDGRLIASYGNLAHAEVTIIDCKPIPAPRQVPSPARPAGSKPATHAGTAQGPPAHAGNGVPGAQAPSGVGLGGPAAPPGTSAQTAVSTQTAAQPAQAGSFGQAAQGASAPQAGLADAPEDTPQLGFSASARAAHDRSPAASVLLTALLLAAAAGMASRSLLAQPHSSNDLQRTTA